MKKTENTGKFQVSVHSAQHCLQRSEQVTLSAWQPRLSPGGPGALFWMWIAALLGTATKYSECLLAIKYRVVAKDGHIVGGPFYYIENWNG